MTARARAWSVTAAAVLLGGLAVLRASSAPPWPDDWDGIGFVASITRFDMDHFAPHAPGYPVYVALLRVAARLAHDPIAAANLVAVASGVVAVALTWLAARRAIDPSRAWWVAFAVASAPLVWRASTAIGSEAPALMLAALGALGLTLTGTPGALAVGAAAGLGLGTRLSWAPIYVGLLVLAPRAFRLRALAVALVACLAWAVPLAVIVGPTHLLALLRTHGEGHWTRWGGTALRDPGVRRVAYLARDLFVDGMGAGTDGLGLAIAVVGLALAKLGYDEWRASGFPHVRLVAIALGPYLAWIAVAQNVRQQPRHALPLVVALAVLAALAATSATRARTVGMLFFTLVAIRTFSDASERRDVPPAGAQLAERVAAMPDRDRVLVLGGPSVRFFELTDRPAQALTVGTLGDASLALGRMSSLPGRVLVTGEVEGRDRSPYPLTPFATLCRPPRLDRRAPCLAVFEWHPPFLDRAGAHAPP
jgi:hypothetical protein